MPVHHLLLICFRCKIILIIFASFTNHLPKMQNPYKISIQPRNCISILLQTPQEGSIKSDFVSFCNSQQNQCCEQNSVPSNSRGRSRLRSVSVDNIQKNLNISESNLTRTKSFETSFKEKRSKTASPEIKVTTDDVFIRPKRPRSDFSIKLINLLDSNLICVTFWQN